MAKILIVDDEENIVELIKFNLEKEGHHVIANYNGDFVLLTAEQEQPQVIILDLMLPGTHGLEICKKIRHNNKTLDIPIIILSASNDEIDKVLAFEIGADDYITKPFSPRELIARIKVQLRRNTRINDNHGQRNESKAIQVGNLILKPDRYEVLIDEKQLSLGQKEFELLKLLISSPGKVLKRDFIIDHIWGYDHSSVSRTLDVHIRYLRQKIETDPDNPKFIETIRGVGYRFKG